MKRKVIALLVICVMVLSGCGKTTPEEKSEETVQDIQQKEIADDFEELMEGTRELYEKVAENKLLDSLEFQKQVIEYLGQKGYAAVDMKDQVDDGGRHDGSRHDGLPHDGTGIKGRIGRCGDIFCHRTGRCSSL